MKANKIVVFFLFIWIPVPSIKWSNRASLSFFDMKLGHHFNVDWLSIFISSNVGIRFFLVTTASSIESSFFDGDVLVIQFVITFSFGLFCSSSLSTTYIISFEKSSKWVTEFLYTVKSKMNNEPIYDLQTCPYWLLLLKDPKCIVNVSSHQYPS